MSRVQKCILKSGFTGDKRDSLELLPWACQGVDNVYCTGRAEAELRGPGATALDGSAVMSTSMQKMVIIILEKAIVLEEKAVTMFPCLNNQSV